MKTKNKIQETFNRGEKLVYKSFIAFFISSEHPTTTIIASKKIGNAVKRNLAKRRLREITRNHNFNVSLIVLARNNTIKLDFEHLKKDWQLLIKNLEKSSKNDLNIS